MRDQIIDGRMKAALPVTTTPLHPYPTPFIKMVAGTIVNGLATMPGIAEITGIIMTETRETGVITETAGTAGTAGTAETEALATGTTLVDPETEMIANRLSPRGHPIAKTETTTRIATTTPGKTSRTRTMAPSLGKKSRMPIHRQTSQQQRPSPSPTLSTSCQSLAKWVS